MQDPKTELILRLAAEVEVPFELVFVDLGEAGRLKRRLRELSDSEIYCS